MAQIVVASQRPLLSTSVLFLLLVSMMFCIFAEKTHERIECARKVRLHAQAISILYRDALLAHGGSSSTHDAKCRVLRDRLRTEFHELEALTSPSMSARAKVARLKFAVFNGLSVLDKMDLSAETNKRPVCSWSGCQLYRLMRMNVTEFCAAERELAATVDVD